MYDTDLRDRVHTQVTTAHRTAQILILALGGSIVVYVVIGMILIGSGETATPQTMIPFYVASLFLALASIAYRRAQLRPMRLEGLAGVGGVNGLVKHLVTTTLISAFLAEVIGLLALLVAIMGASPRDVLTMGIVALIVTLSAYPRRAAWQDTVLYFAASAPEQQGISAP